MSSVASAVRSRSFRVALELTASGPGRAGIVGPLAHSDYWIELTNPPALDLVADPPSVARIYASDLREAQRLRAGIRADLAATGRDPDSVTVLLDVDTIVAPTPLLARTELARLDSSYGALRESVSYVGTPSGLAGLIADIGAAEVADGVTLRPLSLPGSLELIVDEVAVLLRDRGLAIEPTSVTQLVRTFRQAS